MHEINENQIFVSGYIFEEPTYSHCAYGQSFHTIVLQVCRLSGQEDYLPVILPSRVWADIYIKGAYVKIAGQLRSYNEYEQSAPKLRLRVYAKEILMQAEAEEDENAIMLEGYLCKAPKYRKTPFGREITDMLLAVNRGHNKSDYIPVIVWGKNAQFANDFTTGQKVRIEGRFQSRVYEKQLQNGTLQERTAYEVSANTIYQSL